MNTLKIFAGGIAIAITLTLTGGIAATAQTTESADPSSPQPSTAPTLQELPVPQDLPSPSPSSAQDAPESAQGLSSPSQVELPFTDVSPDHWAYEALLFLSTGSRQ